MPGLTRFAVMQHLSVLEEAGLVLVRREGRQRYNYSNPSILRELYEQWVTPLASGAAEAAQHLRRYAETRHEAIPNMNETTTRQVKIELETRIRAPKSVVYAAMTEGYNDWWPHRTRPDAVVFMDPEIGGSTGERWPDGGGLLYGTVMMVVPGEKLMVASIGLMGDYTATNLETLTEEDGETVHKKRLHLWGDVPEQLETMLREGAASLVRNSLKTYCEAKAGNA